MEQQEISQPKAKTNSFAKIAIGLGALIIGGVIGVVINGVVAKPTTDGDDKKPSNNTTTSYDYGTYKELARRTNLIVYQMNSTSESHAGTWALHDSLESLNNISFEQRATIAHNATGEDFPAYDDKKWVKLTDDDIKALGSSVPADANAKEFYLAYHDFDITKTSEQYKSIFGEELDLTKDVIKLSYAFPGIDYLYVPKSKTLYVGGGGGMIPERDYFYINSINISEGKAAVDFNMVNSSYDYTESLDYTINFECYDDFGSKHRISNCADYLFDGINDQNYKSLQNYRLNFEDDGTGNFVYKSAELVK
jgi:hypothetical protein